MFLILILLILLAFLSGCSTDKSVSTEEAADVNVYEGASQGVLIESPEAVEGSEDS